MESVECGVLQEVEKGLVESVECGVRSIVQEVKNVECGVRSTTSF